MVSLERLESLDDRQIQDWLRKVDFTTLAIALLGAGDSVKGRVLRSLSRTASTALDGIMRKYGALDAKELVIRSSADRLETLI